MKRSSGSRNRICMEVIVLSILTALFGGCIRRTPDKPAAAAGEIPGELIRIRWECSGGAMDPESDFSILVTPDEIVHAEFWPEEYASEMTVRDRVPITEEQWADLVKITEILWPLMTPIREADLSENPFLDENGNEIEILDGGDYDNWTFTWKTEEGEEEIRVYPPQDRRIRTLMTLLHELADPIGREIVWYDPPKLCGIYFRNEKKGYSYQCTPVDNTQEAYYCFFYFRENGERASLDRRIDREGWQKVYDFCEPLGLDAFPSGSSTKDPLTCSLYYDDGTQKTVIPDKDTTAKLLAFFEEMRDGLR